VLSGKGHSSGNYLSGRSQFLGFLGFLGSSGASGATCNAEEPRNSEEPEELGGRVAYWIFFANCTLGSFVVLSVVAPYTNALPDVIVNVIVSPPVSV